MVKLPNTICLASKTKIQLEVICHADKLGDMLYACTERIAHMKWYGYDFKYYV